MEQDVVELQQELQAEPPVVEPVQEQGQKPVQQQVIEEDDDMATRKPKAQGKGPEVNGEGPEKVDGTSTTKADLATYTVQDDNPKVAGMAKGATSAPNA